MSVLYLLVLLPSILGVLVLLLRLLPVLSLLVPVRLFGVPSFFMKMLSLFVSLTWMTLMPVELTHSA
jgi:hypothetical protein